MSYDLDPLQTRTVEQLHAVIASGGRRILIQYPTGGGKAVVAAHLIRQWIAEGKRILFAAPRRELIPQTCQKLTALGISDCMNACRWPASTRCALG